MDEAGVVERELGRGHRVVAEAVGLDEEGLLDQIGGIEAADLARDLEGQVLASLTGDPVQNAQPFPDGLPVRVGAQSIGGDHADPGDDRAPWALSAHRVLPPGPVRSTADWKPPNPLPTESTFLSFRGRASRGT